MNDNHPNPRPLWKMSDAELSAIVNRRASVFGASRDDRAERALEELRARAEDRANLPDDTPSLDPPWWAIRMSITISTRRGSAPRLLSGLAQLSPYADHSAALRPQVPKDILAPRQHKLAIPIAAERSDRPIERFAKSRLESGRFFAGGADHSRPQSSAGMIWPKLFELCREVVICTPAFIVTASLAGKIEGQIGGRNHGGGNGGHCCSGVPGPCDRGGGAGSQQYVEEQPASIEPSEPIGARTMIERAHHELEQQAIAFFYFFGGGGGGGALGSAGFGPGHVLSLFGGDGGGGGAVCVGLFALLKSDPMATILGVGLEARPASTGRAANIGDSRFKTISARGFPAFPLRPHTCGGRP